jgi:hypothetical protein
MFSILNSRLLQRSFLARLLQTTGLSLALMTTSVACAHADDVTVQGTAGADGANGVNPGDPGQAGLPAGPTFANASSGDPVNKATAIGGNGGGGGTPGGYGGPETGSGAPGGPGGDATATAATSIISGPAEADAISVGGGGGLGSAADSNNGTQGGPGGFATASATGSSGSGNATVSASAMGGYGGSTAGEGDDSVGGDATASSTAIAGGSGDASSSANAGGGGGGNGTGGGFTKPGGSATATADATATGGGKAIANAVATQGAPSNIANPHLPMPPLSTANATSNAETVNGALAEAISSIGVFSPAADGSIGEAESTAATSLRGVSVQTTVTAPSFFVGTPAGPTTDAIAQGGSAPTFSDAPAYAISTVLPDDAYTTSLIIAHGGTSNIIDALLGQQNEIFGTADQFGSIGSATSTFDFSFRGDLLLAVIDPDDADIIVNGQVIQIGNSDTVLNLGSNFGPNIDLTIQGEGVFAIGGAVPEASTWAMLLLGFAGLGFAGYRQTRGRSQSA